MSEASKKSTGPPARQSAAHPLSTSILGTILWSGLVAVLFCGLGFLFSGKTGIEKTLTSLVMPIGAMWALLTGCFLQQLASGRPRQAIAPGGLWLLFTICGSPWLGDFGMRYLESREQLYSPAVDPALDVLVVLGGGTTQGPTRAQAGASGDRVLYAAQLYLQGRARRLITTGTTIPSRWGERTPPNEQTVEIWTALGIPLADIQTLSGINTFQEMESLKDIMPEFRGQRVGLLTSAWHLPRAMRLARAQGMTQLIPVAADHHMQVESRSFTDYLPSAGNFERLARVQRELMAGLIGR